MLQKVFKKNYLRIIKEWLSSIYLIFMLTYQFSSLISKMFTFYSSKVQKKTKFDLDTLNRFTKEKCFYLEKKSSKFRIDPILHGSEIL